MSCSSPKMSSNLAFLQSLPVSFNRSTILHRKNSVTPHRPRKRARIRAIAIPDPDDSVPKSIRALDMLELQRRENLPPSQNQLDPAAKEALFRDFPALSRLEAELQHKMAQPDYDPSDHRVYSWAYRYLRPWGPSRLLQFTVTALVAYSATRLARVIRSRFAPSTIASVLVVADKYATLTFATVIPILLLVWALFSARSEKANTNDAMRRCTLMFTATAPTLVATWLITASGNLALGLAAGVLTRLYLAASLWFWRDLTREIFVSSAFTAPFFCLWRCCTSASVILAGSAIRLLPLFTPRQLPLRGEFLFRANRLRVNLGVRFPVAFSLCNDTRGLFLVGSIVFVSLLLHGLYLFIFATDFFRMVYHRRCLTPMTRMMIRAGMYQPNVHPDEILRSRSAPDPEESFLPSAPMLLRRKDAITTDSILVDEGIMPVLAYLDKEDELLRRDGIERWLKPRAEQVPLTNDLSREKRSVDALFAWSRPLEKDEANKSFMEFFETLENDEYVYDPVSGNWIFENAGTLGDHAFGEDIGRTDSSDEHSESERQDLTGGDTAVQIQADEEGLQIEVSPDLEPWLRRLIEEERTKDDDTDDPSVPVYV